MYSSTEPRPQGAVLDSSARPLHLKSSRAGECVGVLLKLHDLPLAHCPRHRPLHSKIASCRLGGSRVASEDYHEISLSHKVQRFESIEANGIVKRPEELLHLGQSAAVAGGREGAVARDIEVHIVRHHSKHSRNVSAEKCRITILN